MSAQSAYQKAVTKLYELQKFGIKLGLSSTANLLEGLGNPHHGLACAHLAGTNGKGSVGAMLEAALIRAGVKVGFYTSPHLERFTERFRIRWPGDQPGRGGRAVREGVAGGGPSRTAHLFRVRHGHGF